MALRGKPPVESDSRLKVGQFGDAGVGKSFGSIWPHCYFIDTERGARHDQYRKAILAAGGHYWFCNDLDEIIAECRELETTKHPFQTVVIDPITIPYDIACDVSAIKNGTEYGRHKIDPDRAMKRLFSILDRLDMNVIVNFHEKDKWLEVNGKLKQEGVVLDGYKKSKFALDLLLEVQLRGSQRVAIVRKSRLEGFTMGATVGVGYEAMSERFGLDAMTREAVPAVLVAPERLVRLRHLLDVVKVDETKVAKLLAKNDVDDIAELSAKAADEVIAFLEKQVTPEPPKEAAK